jgi:hypothetical protein
VQSVRPRGAARVIRPAPVRASIAVAVVTAVLLPLPGGLTVARADDAEAGETPVGELVEAWPDQENAEAAAARGESGPLTWIDTAGHGSVRVSIEQLAQRLGVGPEDGVPVGATVGDLPAHEVLAADVIRPAPAPETPPVAASAVTNEVLVVRVLAGGATDDPAVTTQQAVDLVNGPVHDYWSEQTDGAIQLAPTGVPEWVTTTAGCESPFEMWDGGTGRSSGGMLYVRGLGTSIVGHQFGHNFGLGHSSAGQCGPTRFLPGSETVGLIRASPAVDLTLVPVSPAGRRRALRLTMGSWAVYWPEYRHLSGQDAWLADSRNTAWLQSGVFGGITPGRADTGLRRSPHGHGPECRRFRIENPDHSGSVALPARRQQRCGLRGQHLPGRARPWRGTVGGRRLGRRAPAEGPGRRDRRRLGVPGGGHAPVDQAYRYWLNRSAARPSSAAGCPW